MYSLQFDAITIVKHNKGEFEVAYVNNVGDGLVDSKKKTLEDALTQKPQYDEVRSISVKFSEMNFSRNPYGGLQQLQDLTKQCVFLKHLQ